MSLPIPLPPPIPLGRSVRYIPRMFGNNEQKKIEAVKKDSGTRLWSFTSYRINRDNTYHTAFWLDSNRNRHDVIGLNG